MATGWQPVTPGSIGTRVLSLTHLDADTTSLRASPRAALALSTLAAPDAEERRSMACPACGWFEAGINQGPGSFGICPSCFFQPGFDDDPGASALADTPTAWRAWWIVDGMPWRSVGYPQPAGWDPIAQLVRYLGAVDRG